MGKQIKFQFFIIIYKIKRIRRNYKVVKKIEYKL